MKILFLLFTLVFTPAGLAQAVSELRVAMFLEPPFVDLEQDELVGENIEICKLLAKSINLTPVFLRCPFARCMTMMENGQADMIIGLRKTAEREKFLIFLTPPYRIQHYPLRFYTRADSNIFINKYEDLLPLSIGVMRGATYYDQFDTDVRLKKIELTSRKQLVNMLLKSRIDTFLEREESILPLVPFAQYQSDFKLADYVYDHAVESYIAISKQSQIKTFGEQLSQQLHKFMHDGSIETIMSNRPDVFGPQTQH
jgi:polar amino acid transport system substrate-binding protein